MAYQALYRVWRSQTFSDIVGQQAITQTLKNAIATQKTSHAYLFTGPRGTGKTSAAKIFAKAINCPNQVDGEPCNHCEICEAITKGTFNDVMEIDAASNNGVDEIRELRDKVKYAPTEGKFKVYIIDEVHMLSSGAFNALLKTLEEPPKSVIFILATTEPHKIPATIISRTQRFDFKKISVEAIVAHLEEILQTMALTYEKEALYVVAKAAEGGMRDALSILDQVISFSGDTLTKADALEVTGSLSSEELIAYLQKIVVKDVSGALEVLTEILKDGKEPKRFIENVMNELRDLLMEQKAPNLLALQRGNISDSFKELSQKITGEEIYRYLNILNETQQDLRFASVGRIYLEVMTVKLGSLLETTPQLPMGEENSISSSELLALQQELQQLKAEIKELKENRGSFLPKEMPTKASVVHHPSSQSQKIPQKQIYGVLKEATREYLRSVQDNWEDLLQLLTVTQRAMLKSARPRAASKEGLVVTFDYEILSKKACNDLALHEGVKQGLGRLIQYEPEFIAIPEEVWPSLRQNFLQEQKTISKPLDESALPVFEEEKPKEDSKENVDIVQPMIDLLGDAVVKIKED